MSKSFRIERGTKQGNPISPILFNACLESILRKIKAKWRKKKHGITLKATERRTNLRFADDLLLIGTSLAQARAMLSDLISEASKYGL